MFFVRFSNPSYVSCFCGTPLCLEINLPLATRKLRTIFSSVFSVIEFSALASGFQNRFRNSPPESLRALPTSNSHDRDT